MAKPQPETRTGYRVRFVSAMQPVMESAEFKITPKRFSRLDTGEHYDAEMFGSCRWAWSAREAWALERARTQRLVDDAEFKAADKRLQLRAIEQAMQEDSK